jgi:hypothetical protein
MIKYILFLVFIILIIGEQFLGNYLEPSLTYLSSYQLYHKGFELSPSQGI